MGPRVLQFLRLEGDSEMLELTRFSGRIQTVDKGGVHMAEMRRMRGARACMDGALRTGMRLAHTPTDGAEQRGIGDPSTEDS